ncbi:MAG: sensor histidine kinase [Nitrososphaera sp.]|nr:sensor histidine kinase [Nitrososphaera sp.]
MVPNSARGKQWRWVSPRARVIGLASVLLIAIFSFALFFYIQNLSQENIKTTLFERESAAQVEATRRMSEHIGSDLDLVINTIEGLANSYYLQQGDLYSANSKKLVNEKYEELNPRINRLLILDKNNVVTISLSPSNLETFLSSDFSQRDWVIETRERDQPLYSDGFERQDIYRIFVSYPIINKDSGEFMGIIAVSIPTVTYFSYYANVLDINSQFLVVFNREGTILAVGASQDLVGKSFFSEETQTFINHDPILNNLTRSLLDGNSGYGVYDYGRGERINTQSPVYVRGQPLYFIQLVTPTSQIYSEIDSALQAESAKFVLLLLGTLVSIAVLTVFLVKWNATLGREVQTKTKELANTNELLQNNLKMQKEFLDIAAHELRTPVQPILGLAEVLQARGLQSTVDSSGASSPASTRERMLLEVIIRNARRLQKLTENLLDVSRIDSGSLRLDKERFDLGEVVASTLQDFKSSFDDNTKISIIATPFEQTVVVADKDRIVQVLSNLLHNSQAFVKEGTIHVGIAKENSTATVTVRDDGEGIHQDVLPRLFSKFVTKSDRGTGLGLYISKGIVEAHGGRIWAENNKEGRGASFHFTLPLAT